MWSRWEAQRSWRGFHHICGSLEKRATEGGLDDLRVHYLWQRKIDAGQVALDVYAHFFQQLLHPVLAVVFDHVVIFAGIQLMHDVHKSSLSNVKLAKVLLWPQQLPGRFIVTRPRINPSPQLSVFFEGFTKKHCVSTITHLDRPMRQSVAFRTYRWARKGPYRPKKLPGFFIPDFAEAEVDIAWGFELHNDVCLPAFWKSRDAALLCFDFNGDKRQI